MSEPTPAEHAATIGREGMVTVYDHAGEYLGCMGIQTWQWLRESKLDARALAALAERAAELERMLAVDEQQIMDRIADWEKANQRAERAEAAKPPSPAGRPAMSERWHRIRGGWRCWVGLHRLQGHIACRDGVHVSPYNPHARRPPKGAWRVCTWCGATWIAAYDGLSPFWQRREAHDA